MFANRKDGGIQLAAALEKYKNRNALVLGIPRGGAETAYYVAKYLDTEFSLLVSRKLGIPENPEAAFGAVAEDGSIYLSPDLPWNLSEEKINSLVDKQKMEIARRIKQFRNGAPLPEMRDRIVILVDDGIATGATLFAAIQMCRKLSAGKVVVAAPIAGMDTVALLEERADEVIVLDTPEDYFAVSQGYKVFYNLDDQEVQQIMQHWSKNSESKQEEIK